MIHDSNTPATDVQDVANENQAESHFQANSTPPTYTQPVPPPARANKSPKSPPFRQKEKTLALIIVA